MLYTLQINHKINRQGMKMKKQKQCLLIFIMVLVFISIISADQKTEANINEYDLKVLEHSDPYSAYDITIKIKNAYNSYGKEAVNKAIPVIIKNARELSKKEKRVEGEGELLARIIHKKRQCIN